MIKHIDNYFVEVKGELVDNCHPVIIIKLNKDNTYDEKTLYFGGSLDTFKNMSELHMINLLDNLIKVNNHSKFNLELETMYAIK